jgi:hypothetical protein
MKKRTTPKFKPCTKTTKIDIPEPSEGRQYYYLENRFEQEDELRSAELTEMVLQHDWDTWDRLERQASEEAS